MFLNRFIFKYFVFLFSVNAYVGNHLQSKNFSELYHLDQRKIYSSAIQNLKVVEQKEKKNKKEKYHHNNINTTEIINQTKGSQSKQKNLLNRKYLNNTAKYSGIEDSKNVYAYSSNKINVKDKKGFRNKINNGDIMKNISSTDISINSNNKINQTNLNLTEIEKNQTVKEPEVKMQKCYYIHDDLAVNDLSRLDQDL